MSATSLLRERLDKGKHKTLGKSYAILLRLSSSFSNDLSETEKEVPWSDTVLPQIQGQRRTFGAVQTSR
jgi:hypothetical protein